MKADELIKLGLSPNEAKCYLALLELGSGSANEISRKSGVHRVAVYDALRGLREKGLVSQIMKANKLFFEAANPAKIKEIIDEKKRVLENAEKIIPQLEVLSKAVKEKQEVHSFKGVAGLKTVFQDMLNSRTEILDFGAEWRIKDVMPYYYPQWDNERVRKNIKMRIVANVQIKSKAVKKLRLTKIRFVPQEFTSQVSTYIYENKVAMIMWVDSPLAVVVEHSKIADSYRNYFEYMWKTAKT